jgi:CDP-glycerol glycerophosphotransferase (TagB/SpsB family)
MHLAADYIISSHADEFVINPFDNYSHPYRNMLALKKFIFLQHGVTKDDISGWLNRFNKNINGFIVAAYPEERSMFDYDYYYSSENIWLTGFARFDRLYHDEKKRITIMPTWRHYLMTGYDNLTGIWNISEGFKESDYFIFYNSLINNEKLLNACEKNGYTLCFLPHPNIIPHISLFNHDDRVKFYSINDEYRDVYAQSDLVLTDYSSAVFDFAYLRKPLLYTHFDSERFFAGSHVYVKGYFDYERDGFGEITTTLDETVDRIIEYMENGCKLKDKYRERIDNFFAYNDKNNCQRIFNRIVNQQH